MRNAVRRLWTCWIPTALTVFSVERTAAVSGTVGCSVRGLCILLGLGAASSASRRVSDEIEPVSTHKSRARMMAN